MNRKACKALRAYLREAGRKSDIPHEVKRSYAALTSRERGKLRKHWVVAATLRRLRGDVKAQAKSALVDMKDLKL